MALAAIERMTTADDTASPTARHDEAVADRERATAEVRERLAADAEALATFDAAMRSSDVFLPARERYKTNCIKVIGEIRACLLEVGRRMVERGALDRPDQVFFLVEGELDHFRHEPESFTDDAAAAGAGLHGPLRPRAAVHGHRRGPAARRVDPARRVHRPGGRGRGPCSRAPRAPAESPAVGPASSWIRRIPSPSSPGDILVTANTDPAWTPLFVPAGGVVTEIGALGSHAMIISRELGIPCVVSVRDATHLIADGVEVVVDGTKGTVTVGGA